MHLHMHMRLQCLGTTEAPSANSQLMACARRSCAEACKPLCEPLCTQAACAYLRAAAGSLLECEGLLDCSGGPAALGLSIALAGSQYCWCVKLKPAGAVLGLLRDFAAGTWTC